MSTTPRFPAPVKTERLALVARTQGRTGWTLRRILKHLGRTKARYRDGRKREERDARADRPPIAANLDGMLPEEQAAVRAYA